MGRGRPEGFANRGERAANHSLRSRPAHAKTNRDAAIETHATSMKRAWPASNARMAPTAAINRATPATTSATQPRVILIRISIPLKGDALGRPNRRKLRE
jgi:hypothetical protein